MKLRIIQQQKHFSIEHKKGFLNILFNDPQIQFQSKQKSRKDIQQYQIDKFVQENIFAPRNRLKNLRILKSNNNQSVQTANQSVIEKKSNNQYVEIQMSEYYQTPRREISTQGENHRIYGRTLSPQTKRERRIRMQEFKNKNLFQDKLLAIKANNVELMRPENYGEIFIKKDVNLMPFVSEIDGKQFIGFSQQTKQIQNSTACSSARNIKTKNSIRHRKISSPEKKEQVINTKQVLQFKKQLCKLYSNPFCSPENISAKAYIIVQNFNFKNKSKQLKIITRGLHACFNSKINLQIASLTKIMTCILTLELCQKFNINTEIQECQIGTFQTKIEGTTAQLENGQIYTIIQLLYGLMLPSGNDASIALSVFCGALLSKKVKERFSQDTERQNERENQKKFYYQKFIHQMNKKGMQIGMKKTYFSNSHGLPCPTNKCCASDLAILIQYCLKNITFRKIVGSQVYECLVGKKKKISNSLQLKKVKWQNTHNLLQKMPHFYQGIKTGITEIAGPCLASLIKYNERQFIIVVLHSKSLKYRYKDTEKLRQWLFLKEGLTNQTKMVENQ